jgi:hypothetical protein
MGRGRGRRERGCVGSAAADVGLTGSSSSDGAGSGLMFTYET